MRIRLIFAHVIWKLLNNWWR